MRCSNMIDNNILDQLAIIVNIVNGTSFEGTRHLNGLDLLPFCDLPHWPELKIVLYFQETAS